MYFQFFSDDGMFLHNGAYTVKSISMHAHFFVRLTSGAKSAVLDCLVKSVVCLLYYGYSHFAICFSSVYLGHIAFIA